MWVRIEFFKRLTKGQLISKCPFGVKTYSKIPAKNFPGFFERLTKGMDFVKFVHNYGY